MPKENLKDKLDGNELDLGLSNLTTVPVKELAALPKATVLDLSNNVIATLPDTFCSLTHLVKIDLSKNLLTELPDNFGNLRNLQHLDLLGNKLSMLPLSFARLDKLRWLDLKDNPLDVGLKKNAGDCLNEQQCKRCAQNILRYMRDLSSELERIKQKKLQKEREQEALRKEKEEQERRKIREERKAEKERKRQQGRQKYQARTEEEDQNSSSENEKQDEDKSTADSKKGKKGSGLCAKMIMSFFLTIIFMAGMIYVIQVYCDREKNDAFCNDYGKVIIAESNALMDDFDRYYKYIRKEIQRWLK